MVISNSCRYRNPARRDAQARFDDLGYQVQQKRAENRAQ